MSPVSAFPGAVAGALVLAGPVVAHGMNILGSVALARLLGPGEFGAFAIFAFYVTLLTALGDAGLSTSLLRQTREPGEADHRAVFTTQLLLSLAAAIVFWSLAPRFARAYDLPPGSEWWLRLATVSLVLTSFRLIPFVRLERALRFDRLASIDLAQSLVFNGVAVPLAFAGNGILSFAVADLARAATGTALTNLFERWRPRWGWEPRAVRERLRFGVPYQGIHLVTVARNGVGPVFVGLFLGRADVGRLEWASMVAAFSLLGLFALHRLYIPVFSRLQERHEDLRRHLEQMLFAANALVAPLAVLTLVLIEPITRFVFGEKWLDAVPLFHVFWVGNVVVPTATPLLGLLHALGQSRIGFGFAIAGMTGAWALGVPLILAFGPVGFAFAVAAVQVGNLLLVRVARARVSFRFLPVVGPVWGFAAASGIAVAVTQHVRPVSGLADVALYAAAGGGIYAAVLGLVYASEIRSIALTVRRRV